MNNQEGKQKRRIVLLVVFFITIFLAVFSIYLGLQLGQQEDVGVGSTFCSAGSSCKTACTNTEIQSGNCLTGNDAPGVCCTPQAITPTINCPGGSSCKPQCNSSIEDDASPGNKCALGSEARGNCCKPKVVTCPSGSSCKTACSSGEQQVSTGCTLTSVVSGSCCAPAPTSGGGNNTGGGGAGSGGSGAGGGSGSEVTCNGTCFSVSNNCGEVGRVAGSGTCPSGQLCCGGFPGGGGGGSTTGSTTTGTGSAPSQTGDGTTTQQGTTDGQAGGGNTTGTQISTQVIPSTNIFDNRIATVIIGFMLVGIGYSLYRRKVDNG